MKAVLFFFLCFTVPGSWLEAQERVIEWPEVGNSNAYGVDIRKIVCSEDATVLWMDLYSCAGNWVNIISRTVLQTPDGKNRYKLLACEGMEMDKQTTIPEQGYVSCKLTFEPVAPECQTVDYVEGPGTNTWFIGDIHLYPEKKKAASVECLIRGEVRDRPYSGRMLLTKAGGDTRAVGTSVPIRDGKFEYRLSADVCEAYDLTFEDEQCGGSWCPVTFFAEPGTVEMVLYPKEQWEKNVIRGGKENQLFQQFLTARKKAVPLDEFYERRDRMMEEGKYYTEETKNLNRQISETEDRQLLDSLFDVYNRWQRTDRIYSPEGLAMEEELLSLVKQQKAWEMDYYRNHPSLAAYYALVRDYRSYMQSEKYNDIPRFKEFGRMDAGEVKDLVDAVYRPLFPEHPYTKEMDRFAEVADRIRVGGRYIDFVAPDLVTGEPVRLSEQIRGKIALLDLWASWCGPCRRHAKEMIPVYEKYKDQGFIVVGVAREKSQFSGLEAARKDRHPWQDLLELNDRGEIWNLYGIGNAGGGTFLVDREGTILVVDPTPEDIVRIMEEQK